MTKLTPERIAALTYPCTREEFLSLLDERAELAEKLERTEEDFAEASRKRDDLALVIHTEDTEARRGRRLAIAERDQLQAEVADWKKRWNEIQPSRSYIDAALYTGRVIAERDALKAEVERMRPVYEAAKAWRSADREMEHGDDPIAGERFRLAWDALNATVDAALATEAGTK